MKRKLARLFIISVILISALRHSNAQSWLWARTPVFLGNPFNQSAGEGFSVATDYTGNVYSTGYFAYASVIYGNDTLSSINPNMFLVKYNAAGIAQWARGAKLRNIYSSCISNFVTTDQSGNVLITGYFRDTITLNSTMLISKVGTSAFVAKYNPSGVLLWAAQSRSTHFYGNLISGNSIAVDHTGNIYIAGQFGDTLSFGAQTLIAFTQYNTSSFLVKYDSSGNVLWARGGVVPSFSSSGLSNAVAIDAGNNPVITGRFYDTLTLGTQTLISHAKAGEIFTARYDPSGNVLWARQSVNRAPYNSGNGSVSGNAIATDRWGNIYITGDFQDTITFGNIRLISPYPQIVAYGDIFITRYDSTGNVVWAQAAQPATKADYNGWGITVDTFGHIYFVGGGVNFSNGNALTFTINFGGHTFTAPGQPSWECSLILQLDTAGIVQCGEAIPVGGDDYTGIATDPSGKYVYLGGDYNVQYSSVSIGNTTLTFSPGQVGHSEDPYVLRWQPCISGAPMSASATHTDVICHTTCSGTASAVPNGGAGPYTFLWNTQPADTAQHITGLCAGQYNVTITDYNGSKATASVVVANPVVIASVIHATKDTLCTNDSTRLFVTGNTSNLQWLSSPDGNNYTSIQGATDSVFSFSAGVTQVFRVISGTGNCVDTSAPFSLFVNPLPVPFITTTDSILCSGDSTLLCTANTFTSYLWNNNAITNCTTVNAAGGYWLTVTDNNGCSAVSGHQNIAIYPVPTVSITVRGDTLSSFGQSNYQWKLNDNPVDSATGSVFVVKQPGAYTLQVTDSNGCVATSNAVTITGINQLSAENEIALYPNPFSNTVSIEANKSSQGIQNVEIFDISGRLITSVNYPSPGYTVQFGLSYLANGFYYFKIKTPTSCFFESVVKQ